MVEMTPEIERQRESDLLSIGKKEPNAGAYERLDAIGVRGDYLHREVTRMLQVDEFRKHCCSLGDLAAKKRLIDERTQAVNRELSAMADEAEALRKRHKARSDELRNGLKQLHDCHHRSKESNTRLRELVPSYVHQRYIAMKAEIRDRIDIELAKTKNKISSIEWFSGKVAVMPPGFAGDPHDPRIDRSDVTKDPMSLFSEFHHRVQTGSIDRVPEAEGMASCEFFAAIKTIEAILQDRLPQLTEQLRGLMADSAAAHDVADSILDHYLPE